VKIFCSFVFVHSLFTKDAVLDILIVTAAF